MYEFLSGVPVTPVTSFVDVRSDDVRREYLKVVHYMRYALAAYGWPMYMMTTGTGLCRILPRLRSVAHGVRFGYWTTRGLPTRGLDDSRTRQLAYWISRGLDNSRIANSRTGQLAD